MAANLALQDNDTVIQYTSSGESAFAFDFPILDQTEIKVSVDQVEQVLTTDYTVSGVGDAGGGTVTFVSPTTIGEVITIWLDMPIKRLTGFETGASTLLGTDLNTEFARQVRHDQMLRREIRSALRLRPDDPVAGQDMQLPTQATRAGKYLAFNASGVPVPSDGTGTDNTLRADLADGETAGKAEELVAYLRTAAEAGKTIVNWHHKPGVVNRYGDNTIPGTTDMTAAINVALSCDQAVYFLDEDYAANNLVGTLDRQRVIGLGTTRIIKNANGDLFTHSGDDLELDSLQFRGDASTPVYTGHNIVLSGENPRLRNCGSRWAYARALKSTGSAIQIIGTGDIYQSALQDDANEYDIEIGVSGTATLYHDILGIRSTQASGGIHTIDCGSLKVQGCQFGKLFIDSGTSPGGVNGGVYIGNRILGATTVEMSNAIFIGNQFAAVAITFAVGTSGHVLDQSNTITAGATITNNGNGNATIIRNTSTGGYQEFKFGADSSNAVMRADPTSPGRFRFSALELPNNIGLGLRNLADDGDAGTLSATASNNVSLAALIANAALQLSAAGASGLVQLIANGAVSLTADADATAGNTRMLVYDVDNATLERVSVGAADSGGSGYKVLRIPN